MTSSSSTAAVYSSIRSHPQSLPYQPGPPAPTSTTHPGTFAPGTKVTVGAHRVIIQKYLSEGGFAHVYVVKVPQQQQHGTPNRTTEEIAVLKRVAVPDKENLANMKTEVDTMKKLKGHRHIVTYMDSHASQLKGGGYEVFLLMEFCQGGGLIDFMNTRLQNRLTEPEILNIFGDVSEGVAAMHYLDPPLLHRDLKVENVLISTTGGKRVYKLCDFGSSAIPRPAATSAAEGRLIEEDIMKHTTMQYRSPEMIDVYRKQPIDEKSDIWALGVLLYKLCYYTTPFEDQGQMAILNATFKYPQYPSFSNRLKQLIASMLRENPQQRPNIYQVVAEVCSMRGTKVLIKDIYSGPRIRTEKLPSQHTSPTPVVGLSKAAPEQVQAAAVPDIAPMRRGRPKHAQAEPITVSKSPGQDPWAALDSKDYKTRSAAVDELSQKFPSLDEFSLLHDQGTNYQFTPTGKAAPLTETSDQDNLKKRVTQALADEAFANPTITKSASPALATSPSRPITESKPKSNMVSTGVGTSPPLTSPKPIDVSKRPIWRVPSKSPHDPSPSLDTTPEPAFASELPPRPEPTTRRHFFDRHRTKSQTTLDLPKTISSRPSLEGQRPALDKLEPVEKSRSASAHRSSNTYVDSNLSFLRHAETSPPRKRHSSSRSRPNSSHADKEISSDVDFLKTMESNSDETTSTKKHSISLRRRSSSGAKKRSSIPSISLSGTKNLIAGRFSRRFEGDRPFTAVETEHLNTPLSPITASSDHHDTDDEYQHLSIDGPASNVLLEDEASLSPEVRRELERQRLSAEERRVAQAQAEYRASGGHKPGSKASSIQNRVRSLLDGGDTTSKEIKRTAEGYGRFTDTAPNIPPKVPIVTKKPLPPGPPHPAFDKPLPAVKTVAQSQLQAQAPQRTGPKIAPKPVSLRTGTPPVASPTKDRYPGLTAGQVSSGLAGARAGTDDKDWEADFARRFPSLSGIEMVETEIEARGPMRDV